MCHAPPWHFPSPLRLVALRNAPAPHPGLLGDLFPNLVAAMAKSTEHIAVGAWGWVRLALGSCWQPVWCSLRNSCTPVPYCYSSCPCCAGGHAHCAVLRAAGSGGVPGGTGRCTICLGAWVLAGAQNPWRVPWPAHLTLFHVVSLLHCRVAAWSRFCAASSATSRTAACWPCCPSWTLWSRYAVLGGRGGGGRDGEDVMRTRLQF